MPRADGQSLLELSISLHANSGVYALLLGSGVSRAAQIPTGWEIVLDLIRKVAAAEGKESPDDPPAWYQAEFDESPEYDKVVARLAKTPAERRGLLSGYFEPTDEEKEQGLKLPTRAHRSIARLVNLGLVRLILTTNFDRLTENALTDEGLAPNVISTTDDLKGAIPLVHSTCMVVKLHGDYLDSRLRNAPRELAKYPKAWDEFLDQVFDEFGLVVCGWSGEWDGALTSAILRCPTRRFSTYWLVRGELGEDAMKITRQRKADIVPIESADQALAELLERVESLRELDRPHPLSVAAAVATVKRYLPERSNRIRLHDLIMDEATSVHERCDPAHFPMSLPDLDMEGVHARIRQYEAIVERLAAMVAALSFHDEDGSSSLVTRAIERLAQSSVSAGVNVLLALQFYPALLVLYAGGVSATAAGNYSSLAAVLRNPAVRRENRDEAVPAIELLNSGPVLGKNVPRPNAKNEYTPGSNHLFDLLREPLRPYAPTDAEYELHFDTFEYLLAVTFVDLTTADTTNVGWAPVGRFGWRQKWKTTRKRFMIQGIERGPDWDLLKAGFFGGSAERAREVFDAYEAWHPQVTASWF